MQLAIVSSDEGMCQLSRLVAMVWPASQEGCAVRSLSCFLAHPSQKMDGENQEVTILLAL